MGNSASGWLATRLVNGPEESGSQVEAALETTTPATSQGSEAATLGCFAQRAVRIGPHKPTSQSLSRAPLPRFADYTSKRLPRPACHGSDPVGPYAHIWPESPLHCRSKLHGLSHPTELRTTPCYRTPQNQLALVTEANYETASHHHCRSPATPPGSRFMRLGLFLSTDARDSRKSDARLPRLVKPDAVD